MTRPTYSVAIFLLLATAAASFAQAPMRPADPGAACNPDMDYNCHPLKGNGITNTTDQNAARLRNEALKPPASGPEEPEQPVGQPIEPEAPISGVQ